MPAVAQNNGLNATRQGQARHAVFISRPELIGILVTRHGNAFASVIVQQDMLETNDKGQLKRMKKTDNPFLGGSLFKLSKTNIMVNFDYAAAVERRTDGEESAKGGNWSQAYTVDGRLTPLSVHKGDILTRPKAGAEPNKKGEYKLADLEAVTDANGNIIFTVDPEYRRFYLRCEYRGSESKYQDAGGNEIDKAEVEPYLKSQSDIGPVDHHTVTMDNVQQMTIDGVTYIPR